MADAERSALLDLSNELQDNAHSFDFFKAVTVIESLHQGASIGHQGPVADEILRFRGNPSMAFPASDIEKAGFSSHGQIELLSNFIGLYGPSSPLPAHVTEAIIAEQMLIENQELIEYFLTSEQQIRALRDHRLDISRLVQSAAEHKSKLRAGVISSRTLVDKELDALRNGEELRDILEIDEVAAFNNGELLLQVFESPTSKQRDFLDLFNHRLTSFLYRSWHKYRPKLQYRAEAENRFSEWLFALMGAPELEARKASAINWPRLLGFSGLMAMQGNSASVLKQVVSGYFGNIHVEVIEHVERWARVPDDQLNRLGLGPSRLGEDITLGGKVRDYNSKFILQLGPLSYNAYQQFLPNGENYAALRELLVMLMPEQLCCDIRLILKGEEVPECILGDANNGYLGWSGWLGNKSREDREVLLHGAG